MGEKYKVIDSQGNTQTVVEVWADETPGTTGAWMSRWRERGKAGVGAGNRPSYLDRASALDAGRTAAASSFPGAQLKRFDQYPIVLVQWGPPSQPDEVAKARTALSYIVAEALGEEAEPDVVGERVTDSSRDVFTSTLIRYLDDNPSLQTLYVSAHGSEDGLWFQHSQGEMLSYDELGQILAEHLGSPSVTLVMGSCFSLSDSSRLVPSLPSQVSKVYGFTGTPYGSHVEALLVAVCRRETMDFDAISKAIAVHKLPAAMQQALDVVLRELEAQPETPDERVRGTEGVSIRIYESQWVLKQEIQLQGGQ